MRIIDWVRLIFYILVLCGLLYIMFFKAYDDPCDRCKFENRQGLTVSCREYIKAAETPIQVGSSNNNYSNITFTTS